MRTAQQRMRQTPAASAPRGTASSLSAGLHAAQAPATTRRLAERRRTLSCQYSDVVTVVPSNVK